MRTAEFVIYTCNCLLGAFFLGVHFGSFPMGASAWFFATAYGVLRGTIK